MEKILVIDDDEQVCATLKQMLAREGYEVITAIDGKQGVASYKEYCPDLIITDMILPEMDGIEIMTELRQISPDAKIIAISGGGRVDKEYHLTIAKYFGAQKVLAKPIERDVLLETVKAVLKCDVSLS